MTGAVFVVGVSCWYLLRNRNRRFALASIRVASIVGLVATLTVMFTGDRSGIKIAQHQPMKLAAAEGLEKGGPRAPFSIVPGIEVPGALSILATHDIDGFVPGTQDILNGYTDHHGTVHLSAAEKMTRGKKAVAAFADYRANYDSDLKQAAIARKVFEENKDYFGYGHIEKAEDLIPNIPMVYWAFRIMVGGGSFLLLVLILSFWFERRGTLSTKRWLLHAGLWSIPIVYFAGQAGWVVAEVGRQPWAIQDLLPVGIAASQLSQTAVVTTFCIFAVLFTLLLAVEVRIMCKAISEHKQ
jgi:cytochrome d ubiquinol oxidase subunit I